MIEIEKLVISEEELKEIVTRLGEQITRDYAGKKLLLVGILRGSFVFMADLVRKIDLDCCIDFMCVSSYSGTETTGRLRIEKDLTDDPSGMDILFIEDILDTGITLHGVLRHLHDRGAASIKICTLLDKPSRRRAPIEAEYVGAVVPDEFIVGYGLDFNQKYRNLPYIAVPKLHDAGNQ